MDAPLIEPVKWTVVKHGDTWLHRVRLPDGTLRAYRMSGEDVEAFISLWPSVRVIETPAPVTNGNI